jgi:hypothetical protein
MACGSIKMNRHTFFALIPFLDSANANAKPKEKVAIVAAIAHINVQIATPINVSDQMFKRSKSE